MWYFVIWKPFTDVSVEPTASVFRVEDWHKFKILTIQSNYLNSGLPSSLPRCNRSPSCRDLMRSDSVFGSSLSKVSRSTFSKFTPWAEPITMQSALNHILFRFKNRRNLLVIMIAHMTRSNHCGQLFSLVGHIAILIQHCRPHTFTSVNFQMFSPYVITEYPHLKSTSAIWIFFFKFVILIPLCIFYILILQQSHISLSETHSPN